MTTKIKFSDLKTISGYPADEVISALQKDIRRCHFEPASFWALELMESGDRFVKKFWERIVVISVEDVADHGVVSIIATLRDNFFALDDAKLCDRHIQGLKAVKVLCDAKKDRIVNEMYDYLRFKRKDGLQLEIPEYAIDKHTKKGKAQGKDYLHFLEVAGKIRSIVKNKDETYLKELKKYAKLGVSPSTYKQKK